MYCMSSYFINKGNQTGVIRFAQSNSSYVYSTVDPSKFLQFSNGPDSINFSLGFLKISI